MKNLLPLGLVLLSATAAVWGAPTAGASDMAAKRDAAAKVDLKEDIASDWKERRDAVAKVDLKEDIASDWKEKPDAAAKLDLKEDIASDWK